MTPGDRLFLRLPKFESYQPGILNSPTVMPVRPFRPTMPAEILASAARWQQLGREPSLLRHFGQIGRNPRAIRADFDPNGFRSSSPTTPATQCSLAPLSAA
jgi:hypothetical protein